MNFKHLIGHFGLMTPTSAIAVAVVLLSGCGGGNGTVATDDGTMSTAVSTEAGSTDSMSTDERYRRTSRSTTVTSTTASPSTPTPTPTIATATATASAATTTLPTTSATATDATADATTVASSSAATWTYCSQENETCTFSGTHNVKYEAGTESVEKSATASIACNNATFTDPSVGNWKTCWVEDVATASATSTVAAATVTATSTTAAATAPASTATTTVASKPAAAATPAVTASTIVPQAFQSAAMANAAQPANQIQVMGGYPALNTITESGITGNGTVNGTNIRFGKIADPTGTLDPATGKVRQVYQHAMAAGDPTTACCYRTDVSLANGGLQKDTPYWSAFELYIPSATVNSGDNQTIAAIHEGPDTGSGNWELQVNKGVWQICITVEGPSQTWYTISPQPAAGQWHKFVVQYTLSMDASKGVTNVWADGKQVLAQKGINTVAATGDYAKFGMYAFQMTGGTRYDLWRSYYLVKDNGYTLDQITAMLK